METSAEIIEQAKNRFKELEHKGFEWRSFYNGFLEGSLDKAEPFCETCKSGLIDYPEISRRTCRCGSLGYNVKD